MRRLTLRNFGPGVYLLRKSGRVVYVGSSRFVLFRIGAHRAKDFDEVEISFCDYPQATALEQRLIKKHKPPMNRSIHVDGARNRRNLGALLKGNPQWCRHCFGTGVDPASHPDLGRERRAARVRAGVSLASAAAELGICESQLSRLENGLRLWNAEWLSKHEALFAF